MFIGLDANYDEQIDHKPIFSKICEYHEDGIAFWRKYRVHHPFLLPEYSGDGRLYHRSFARIGFTPEQAHLVSFIELLHIPTYGRSKLVPADLSTEHLRKLNDIIMNGTAEHIFVPTGVANLMRTTKEFSWLLESHVYHDGPLAVIYNHENKTVYRHFHFSVYGKFQAQKINEAAAIQKIACKYQ